MEHGRTIRFSEYIDIAENFGCRLAQWLVVGANFFLVMRYSIEQKWRSQRMTAPKRLL